MVNIETFNRNRSVETSRSAEIETRRSEGVALVIVGIDPSRNGENLTSLKFWTNIEKKSKPETNRVKGQISFPGETRKIGGETLNSNMFGALAEFSDNDFLIQNNLFFVSGFSLMEGRVVVNNKPFDLIVLICERSLDSPINPVDEEEVAPNGWMTVDEILKEEEGKVRTFTREIARAEVSERLIGKVVAAYYSLPFKRIPLSSLLPPGFSSGRQFYEERNKKPDVINTEPISK